MKKFIKLIPVFLLLCLISINVNAQDSTSLRLEELNTDVYEDILTEYYVVEAGYAYCSSAVNLTSSEEITEEISVTILDAYGSNVWRVDTSLSAADSNCAVVELNNVFYYLSTVSNPVFTEEGVTFSTNKLGIYIAGGCFNEEDIENFSSGTSNFSIDESTLTQAGTWLGAPYALLDEDGDGVKETCYVYGTMTDTTEITSLTYETYGFYKVLVDNPVVTKAIINCSLGNRTSARSMFDNCENLDSLIFRENFDTSQVINMRDMFSDCGKSSTSFTLDLGYNFNTSKVTKMDGMFAWCGYSSTKFTLDLGEKFNTSQVTSMYGMFENCGKSSTSFTLDLGNNFNTSSVTSMTYMFAWCGYSSTKFTLDLGVKFNTSQVKKMDYMFAYCGNSSTVFILDLGDNFNTSNVTNMSSMFSSCGDKSPVFTLDLGEKFNTSNVTSMTSMFEFCGNSNTNFELDLSSFDMSKVTSYSSFLNYTSPKTLKTPKVCPITNISLHHEMMDTEGAPYSNLPVTTGVSKTLIKPKDMVVTVTNGQAVETGEPIPFNGQINVEDPSSGYVIEYCESSVQELIINSVNDTYGFEKVGEEYVSNNKGVHSSEAKTTFSITAEKDVTLQVNYNVSSEASYDIFKLTLDGTDVLSGLSGYNKGGLSGTYSGTLDLPLTAGEHTLIATYSKDSSSSSGEDTIRISLSGFVMLWSTNVPTKTEAGTYKIPFRVKAPCYNIYEGNVNFVIEEPVYVTIDGKEYSLKKDGEWLGAPYSILDTDGDGVKETCYVYGTMTDTTVINISSSYKTYGFYKVLTDNPTVTKVIVNCSLGSRTSASWLFNACSKLTYLEFGTNFNTSSVLSMYRMFYGCSGLTSLNISNFNTSNVNSMYMMFYNCKSLTSLNVSSFNTSNVTDMSYMFDSCSSLTSLDLSNFDTTNVTNMQAMFNGCSGLKSLNINSFCTSNVTSMWKMFYNCSGLTLLDVINFNTSNVKDMDYMFGNCSNLTSLNISNFNTSNVTNMQSMFKSCGYNTPNFELNISSFNVDNVTMLEGMFDNCKPKKIVLPESIGTRDISLSTTYYGYSSDDSILDDTVTYTKLVAKNPETGLTYLSTQKYYATVIINGKKYPLTQDGTWLGAPYTLLDTDGDGVKETCYVYGTMTDTRQLSSTNYRTYSFYKVLTGNPTVTNAIINCSLGDRISANSMFYNCETLTSLEFGTNFDTSNVTYMQYMFKGCNSLTSLNLNSFNTSNATRMNYMFSICSSLTSLDLSNFNTSKVNDMNSMFYGCTSLTTLNVSSFDTSNVTYKDYMFSDCSALETLKTPSTNTIEGFVLPKTMYTHPENTAYTKLPVTTGTSLTLHDKISNDLPKDGEWLGAPYYLRDDDGDGVKETIYVYDTMTANTEINTRIYKTYGFYKVLAENTDKTGVAITKAIIDCSLGSRTDTKFMFYDCGLATLEFGTNFNTSNITNMNSMFSWCSSLTSLNLNNFDTSKVTDMGSMFKFCESLTSLDLSSFNTSNVTNMTYIFAYCNKLASLDLSNFNTSKVTNMSYMFDTCKTLNSLNLGNNFITSSVTNMCCMFDTCESLASLDLSNFDTSNVTNMYSMFAYSPKLESLNFGANFDTSNVTNMSSMFAGCSGLTILDLSIFDTSKVTDMTSMFIVCSGLTSLKISNFNTGNVTNMGYMFRGCSSLESLDLSNFDTSQVTSMSLMFEGCSLLKSLKINSFNTNNVTDMNQMFSGCSSLTTLDLSNFVTSKVTNMNYMFYNCKSLSTLNLGNNFITSNVTNMCKMFYYCNSLTSLDLRNFETSNVTNMESMFDGCAHLNSIDFGTNFNTSKVTTMYGMFRDCGSNAENLVLDLSGFNTSSVTNLSYMFWACGAKEIDISNFTITSSYSSIFGGNNKVEILKTPKNCSVDDIYLPYLMYDSTGLEYNMLPQTTGESITLTKTLRAVLNNAGDLFGSIDANGILHITGTGANLDITLVDAIANETLRESITGLSFDTDSIKWIATGSGKTWCSGVPNIGGNLVLPSKLEGIGSGEFDNCSGFTGALIIPETVKRIDVAAFQRCSGFSSLTLPSTMENIDSYAFYGCSGFKGNLILPDGITVLWSYVFGGCTGFTGNLVIPDSVRRMDSSTFAGCKGFNGTLTLSNNLENISRCAFNDCSFTGDLVIPNSVTTIDSYAFAGCPGFTGDLILPNSITTIGGSAFNGCTGLNGTLKLPNGITVISDYTFYDCKFTGKLNLPGTLTSIGSHAFEKNCFNGVLNVNEGVTIIKENAFASNNIATAVLPNSLEELGNGCFSHCDKLSKLYVGNSVATVGTRCFYVNDNVPTKLYTNSDAVKNYNWAGDNRTISPMNTFTFALPQNITLKPKYLNAQGAPVFYSAFNMEILGDFEDGSYGTFEGVPTFTISTDSGKTRTVTTNVEGMTVTEDGTITVPVVFTAPNPTLTEEFSGQFELPTVLHEVLPFAS